MMVRLAQAEAALGDDHDVPLTEQVYEQLMAAPRTRGWTDIESIAADGCPAHAGMDPNRSPRERSAAGCPAHAGMELLAVIERTPAERETVAWRKSLT